MKLLLLLGIYLLSVYCYADVIPMNSAPHCTAEGVKKVEVPTFPDQMNSTNFDYSYRLFPSSSKTTKTTVIILPGGPGDTLLEKSPTENGYPYGGVSTDQFHIIYTEPRGLGCNQLATGDFPAKAFGMEYLAADVLAMIRQEKLTDYIIYGASFGTVLATYVADQIEATGLTPPKTIVLEGTLGRGVPGKFTEYISGYSNEWLRVKKLLPVEMTSLFVGSSLPLGYSPEVWGAYIFKQLITGDIPNDGPWLQNRLYPLINGDKAGLEKLKTALEFYKFLLSFPPLLRIPKIFQVLGCEKLFGGWRPDVVIKNGKLLGSGVNICAPFKYEPYDSSRLSIQTPIVYFQGPFDPATPFTSALYHFNHQTMTDRIFVTIDRASHAPLSNSLTTLMCNKTVWAQIDKNPEKLSQALDSCQGWKYDLQFKKKITDEN